MVAYCASCGEEAVFVTRFAGLPDIFYCEACGEDVAREADVQEADAASSGVVLAPDDRIVRPVRFCSGCGADAVVGGPVGAWCVGCAETLADDARSAAARSAAPSPPPLACGCHICGLDAVWAVPWGDAFCALHGAGRSDVRWRGGGLSLREVVERFPVVLSAGWSWPDEVRCPGCGEEYDPARGGGPLYPFDDSVEHPLLWADDADVVSCVCCDTYFVRRDGRVWLTHQA